MVAEQRIMEATGEGSLFVVWIIVTVVVIIVVIIFFVIVVIFIIIIRIDIINRCDILAALAGCRWLWNLVLGEIFGGQSRLLVEGA